MLTINERFPIKKMTLYGSAAFIVGFAGTITMLREYAPRDDAGNISVVHPTNKQDSKSSVSNQIPKTDEKNDTTSPDSASPLTASTPVAGGSTLSTRQASPLPIANSPQGGTVSGGTMSVAPAADQPAPTVSSTPPSSDGSGTTTQPAPSDSTLPTINPLPISPLLQGSVEDTTPSTGLVP